MKSFLLVSFGWLDVVCARLGCAWAGFGGVCAGFGGVSWVVCWIWWLVRRVWWLVRRVWCCKFVSFGTCLFWSLSFSFVEMKIVGNLYRVEDVVEVKEYKRRNMVLEHDNSGYTQYILFELFQGHCDLIEKMNLKSGERIRVDFTIKGRKWKNQEGEEKYFNTLQAWKIIRTSED